MAEDRSRWIIRDLEGKVQGPYSTSQILHYINVGELGGGEYVARYPDGEWQSISKNPEFYDGLLAALALEAELVTPPEKPLKPPPPPAMNRSVPEEEDDSDFEETRTMAEPRRRLPETGQRVVINETRERQRELDDDDDDFVMQKGASPLGDEEDSVDGTVLRGMGDLGDSVILDLGKKEQIIRRGKRRKLKLPLIVAGVAVVGAFFLMSGPPKPGKRIHLREPASGRSPISAERAQEAYVKAAGFYIKDTFDGYWRAQNILVDAVEGAMQNKRLRSLLCLTYRELWPYSYQDSDDLRIFELMAKKTSSMDPGGRDGALCDISLAIARGKYQQAGTLAKTALPNNKLEPVLYEVQAVILGDVEKKYQVATDYLMTIENLSPKWVKPYVLRGKFQIRNGQIAEALQSFKKALELNPDHPEAKIQLGIIHHLYLKKSDMALQYIAEGMNSGDRISPVILVDAYKTLADISLKRKEKAKAREYLEQAFALSPSDEDVRRMYKDADGKDFDVPVEQGPKLGVGDEYFRRGEYYLAQAEYRALFKSDPTNATAAYKAAQCFWNLNQAREAMEWLDKAIKVDRRYIDAYVKKAEYYTERYDYRSADNTLSRARKLAPQNHLVYQGYARLYLQQENFGFAIKFAEQALRLYETDVEALSILVRAYLGLKTADGYSRGYEKAVQLQSLDQGNPKAQSIYIEALEAVQNLSTALSKTEELIELYPYTTEYRLLYGRLLLKDEQYSEAEGVFNQVLQIDDKNKEALLGLGEVLQASGRFNEARERLLQAATLDPSDANSIFLLGELYLRANQPMSAIKQFERVLANNPLYPKAHYFMGKAAMSAGNLGRALNEAEEEAKINPSRPEPQLLLAEIYYLQRNYSKCIASYQKAIKLGVRTDATTYVRESRCMRLAGDPSTARQLLQQALLIESGNPEAWKEMGATCEMLGDMNCAVEGYRQYFNLAPNAPDRRQIEARIIQLQGY